MIKTKGLYHLHLVVRDVRRSLDFYSTVFGVEVAFWAGDDMVFVTTPGSGDLLTLNQDADLVDRAGDNGGLDHFGFRLADPADIDAAVEAVVAAGGTLEHRGARAPDEQFAYCRDPDGYLFEL